MTDVSRVHPDDFDAVRLLINDIQLLESRCHWLGMIQTAHAMNAAKNEAGWEFERHLVAARKRKDQP